MFGIDGVRCMQMRGGTSKGLFIVADDLSDSVAERDEFLLSVMGSPDLRQIDGLGGSHPLTSKVAIVGLSERPDADVEYLFLQVSVDEAQVSDRQNCGNMLAAVGPFAVERGLVGAADLGQTTVRIHMRNTDSVAESTFAVRKGMPTYHGDAAISGVPGTGSPITIDFHDVAGSTCGALLPSGNQADELDGTLVTLIDNGMPVVVVSAVDLGVSGHESCAELEANDSLRERVERIRLAAGWAMHLGDVSETTIPKVTLVSEPRDGGTVCTRTFIPHRCHDAIGVLGAVSVATAAQLPGSPAAALLGPVADGIVRIEHPTGIFDAAVEVAFDDSKHPHVQRSAIVRTARKLMDGTVYPRSN